MAKEEEGKSTEQTGKKLTWTSNQKKSKKKEEVKDDKQIKLDFFIKKVEEKKK